MARQISRYGEVSVERPSTFGGQQKIDRSLIQLRTGKKN